MTLLTSIAALHGVKSAVLGSARGALLEAAGDGDGDAEAGAAISGFVWTALAEAGEQLGLGRLDRLTAAGTTRASVAVAQPDDTVLTVLAEPALAGLEKAVEAALSRNGA